MTRLLKAIQQAVKASGKTRHQISKETGIDESHLSSFTKHGAGLSLEKLEKLAIALNLEILVRAQPTILDEPIESLLLSERACRCLTEYARKPIRTTRELVSCSRARLLAIPSFGETTLTEVRQKLAEHGLKLKGDS